VLIQVDDRLPGHFSERVREVELLLCVAAKFEHFKVMLLQSRDPFESLLVKLGVLARVRVRHPHREPCLDQVCYLRLHKLAKPIEAQFIVPG